MKKISTLVASLAMLTFFSCNSSADEQKKDEVTKDTTSTTTTTPAPVVKPAFAPFKTIMIIHDVKDYRKWMASYKAHDSVRMAYGISQFAIGRGEPDSNKVVVFDKITDVQKAKDFRNSPTVKEAMQKAGVVGMTSTNYAEVIRFADSIPQIDDRVMVKHHVKDFDAWLKVFDGEGADKRASYGLVDRSLARDLDDSDMVYIVFVVTDMAKAKARSSSPELKKLMQDAGVDGAPTITYYKVVDKPK